MIFFMLISIIVFFNNARTLVFIAIDEWFFLYIYLKQFGEYAFSRRKDVLFDLERRAFRDGKICFSNSLAMRQLPSGLFSLFADDYDVVSFAVGCGEDVSVATIGES